MSIQGAQKPAWLLRREKMGVLHFATVGDACCRKCGEVILREGGALYWTSVENQWKIGLNCEKAADPKLQWATRRETGTSSKKPKVNRRWTEEERDQLHQLAVVEKLTTAQIGKMMKRTRNSILGEAHRLNIPLHHKNHVFTSESSKRANDIRYGRVSVPSAPTEYPPPDTNA